MKYCFTCFMMLCFTISNAQFQEGIIHLKGGKTIKGYISFNDSDEIKFKEEKTSNFVRYTFNTIDGFDLTKNGIKKYRYKDAVNEYPRLLQLIRIGKINLYQQMVNQYFHLGPNSNIKITPKIIYYIEKENVTLRTGKKISKSELEYFSDCPILMKKIKGKEIKKDDVYGIVNFYNINCNSK